VALREGVGPKGRERHLPTTWAGGVVIGSALSPARIHQVTIHATITPHALAAIINDSEPPATRPDLALSAQHPRLSCWAPS
jgi:hypothetical protein